MLKYQYNKSDQPIQFKFWIFKTFSHELILCLVTCENHMRTTWEPYEKDYLEKSIGVGVKFCWIWIFLDLYLEHYHPVTPDTIQITVPHWHIPDLMPVSVPVYVLYTLYLRQSPKCQWEKNNFLFPGGCLLFLCCPLVCEGVL